MPSILLRRSAVLVLLALAAGGAGACTDTNNNASYVVVGNNTPPDGGAGAGGTGGGDGGTGGGVVVDAGNPSGPPPYLWYAGGALEAFTRAQTQATNHDGPSVVIRPDGPGTSFHDLAFDRDGNLWTLPRSGDRIYRIAASALVGSVGGTPPAPSLVVTSAALSSAQSLVFDAQGNLWVMNYGGGGPGLANIVRFDNPGAMSGAVTLTAAAIIAPASTPAGAAAFNQGTGIALDGAGNLWLAAVASVARFDGAGAVQGQITLAPGAVLTMASLAGAYVDIAFGPGGALWITGASAGYYAARIDHPEALHGMVTPTPAAIVHLPSSNAFFAAGMAFDSAGALWVAMDNALVALPGASSLTGEVTPTPAVVLGLNVAFAPDLCSKLVFRP
jgi:sugar lactone lactonase YvrE